MDNCGDLPCFRAPGVTVSCWHFPSLKQRLKFLFTGKLWFYCIADSHPPISLAVDMPDALKSRE
jgi:hypothetical protein